MSLLQFLNNGYFAGSVGIGTNNPSAKLHITKDNTTGNALLITNSGSSRSLEINHNADGTGISDEVVRIMNDGTRLFTIESDGKVGIGTDSPNVKLGLSDSSALTAVYQQFTNGTTGTAGANGTFMGIDSDGDFLINNQEAKTIKLYTSDTERMRITGAGNVGIGTTSPASKISVGGSATGFATAMQVWQDGETAVSGDVGGKAATFFGESGVSNSSIVNIYSTNGYTGQNGGEIGFGGKYASNASVAQFAKIRSFKTNASNGGANYGGGLEFWTRPNGSAAVARMTILGDGNVGIGTTSPAVPLHVNGWTRINGSLQLEGGNRQVMAIDNTSLILGTNNAEKMRITSAGSVGIGTTSPVKKLHVKETSGTYEAAIFETNSGGSFIRNIDSTGAVETGIQGGKWSARTSNTQRLVIDSSGNVGIGTTSPTAKLHVADGGGFNVSPPISIKLSHTGYTTTLPTNIDQVSAEIQYIRSYAGTIWKNYLDLRVRGDGGLAANQGGSNIRFFTNSTEIDSLDVERMRIDDAGNVGIGTTSPQSKLQVAGGIQMADDTDTAVVGKVGTMRYRTTTDEPVPVTGIELITNGDFATDTDWTTGTDWVIAGGTANASSATANPIYQTVSGFTAGNKYRVRFEVTAVTSGQIRVYCYVGAAGTFTQLFQSTPLTTGFYEGVFEFGGTNKILRFYGGTGSNTFAGSIDNVSVVEVTEEDASYADMCMQTGASTYEWVNIVRNTY